MACWCPGAPTSPNFKKPFVQARPAIGTFAEAVKALRPTGFIGVSAVPKLFTRESDRDDGRDQ